MTKKLPIGILGGGQLAKMLVDEVHALGLACAVFTFSKDEPAAKDADLLIVGPVHDHERLGKFFSSVDVVIFENEFISIDHIKSCESYKSVEFVPALSVMFELQDKLRQKKILDELGIPHARFAVLKGESWVDEIPIVMNSFPSGACFKWSSFGYDGKGTKVFRHTDSLDGIVRFCEEGYARGATIFAEELIAYRCEVAVISTRNYLGDYCFFPFVVSKQSHGICAEVVGPVSSFDPGLSALEAEAQVFVKKLGDSLGMVGTFAIEMFVDSGGKLLVNEIAPRVHNSGHFTQDACSVNQFQTHVCAAIKKEIGSLKTLFPVFGMLNILGTKSGSVNQEKISKSWDEQQKKSPLLDKAKLHWYGKDVVRPKRKMGHVNLWATSREELENMLKETRSWQNNWQK